MKKTSFIILNIFISGLLFGVANTSLALDSLEGISPTLVSPGIEQEDVSLNPTLTWRPPWSPSEEGGYIPDPEQWEVEYEWEIGTEPGSKDIDDGIVSHILGASTISATLSTRLAPGWTYHWRVRAVRYEVLDIFGNREPREDADESDWMDWGEFTTLGLPSPKIISPYKDGYQSPRLDLHFEWEPVEEAEVYWWEVWNGDKESESVTETKVYPELEWDTSYTCRVKVCISCDEVDWETCELCSNWSTRSFSTKPPEELAEPELISPEDGDTVSPTPILEWEDVPGARYYKWRVKEVKSKITVTEGWVEDPQTEKQIPAELDEISGGYEWTVNACPEKVANEECSGWSAPSVFLVSLEISPPGEEEEEEEEEEEPGVLSAPELSSPCHGKIVSLTPTLRWRSVRAAEMYQWKITGFNPYNTLYTSVNLAKVTDDYGNLLIRLQAGKSYIWRVRSYKEGVYSEWSDPPCVFNTKEISAPGEPTPRIGGGFVCPKDKASCPEGAVCIENPLCAESFDQLIGAIANFIFWLGMALAPLMLVVAGFMFVTSGGDPGRVLTARKLAIYTLIGLAIILLASGLIKVLQSILGYQG